MNMFKRFFHRVSRDELRAFDARDLRIEWMAGNKLQITFLTASYMLSGDTITVVAPIVMPEITPSVVYDEGLDK